jgi:hypothetical protein
MSVNGEAEAEEVVGLVLPGTLETSLFAFRMFPVISTDQCNTLSFINDGGVDDEQSIGAQNDQRTKNRYVATMAAR